MRGGDISNETPPRIIVNVDVVCESEVEEERKLFGGKQVRRKYGKLNNQALSQLWLISSRYGLSVELAAFESDHWTQDTLDALIEKLERRGGNPFNYAEVYLDIEDFIGDLPYRNNLKGVIDLQSRVARYGSWGIELDNL
jgi:hypothetical protein